MEENSKIIEGVDFEKNKDGDLQSKAGIVISDVDFKPKEEKKPLYSCIACKHVVYEESGILALNFGGLPVIVCEKCRTIQLPEAVYNQVKEKMNSKIIV